MTHTQLQFQWAKPHRTHGCPPADPACGDLSHQDPPDMPHTTLTPAASNEVGSPAALPAVSETDGPPVFAPLAAAIESGVFGITEAGPIEPDDEDVASLTAEHANEMIALLADLAAVENGLRTGRDPRTGKLPRTPETRTRLAGRLRTEHTRLQEAYADALAVYAEAFGDEAAAALDVWVRREATNTV
jgi:hypothetical protein